MEELKVKVGLPVHYVQGSGAHSDATITRVGEDKVSGTVDLHVVDGGQKYDRRVVIYSASPVAYTWHFVEDDGEAASDSAPPKSI